MTETVRSAAFSLADAQALIPTPEGGHSVSVLRHGTLNLKLSLPVRPNEQTPHVQDELYIIVGGRGVLYHDGRRDRFTAGDAMFVAAGVEHWFEDFSDDLSVWVVFYGPDGGEVPAEPSP
jgi:mannose-6-phosphate isomerase-like protein (cupin superfamily)